MSGCPSGRCGHTWPEDHTVDEDPDHQSCCYRETHPGSDRCVWHTPDREKTANELKEARADPEIRSQNAPFDELLDGAYLAGCTLEDQISFENTAVRSANFEQADLTGANCFNANFKGSTLSEATLKGTHFGGRFISYTKNSGVDQGYDHHHPSDSYPSLAGTNLKKADLSDSYLSNIDLSRAQLNSADLNGVSLFRSDITNATLYHAELSGANLDGSNLSDTKLGDTDMSNASLREADFTDASLHRGDGISTDFSESTLESAIFKDVTAGRSDFSDSDLTEATFESSSLDPLELSQADFSGATFDNTDLSNVYLGNASFSDARFENVDLSEVFMNHVDCSDAELYGVTLAESWLYNADFSGAVLYNVNLQQEDTDIDKLGGQRIDIAHLSQHCDGKSGPQIIAQSNGTIESIESTHPKAVSSTLVQADFSDAELTDVDFTGRDLTHASFARATCSDVDFSSVTLREATISGADLSDEDLTGLALNSVDLSDSDLSNADFSWSDLTKADLSTAVCHDAVFVNTTLVEATLTQVGLSKATLTGADCENADLSEANLTHASLTNTNLVGADLSGAYLFAATVDGAQISSQTQLNHGNIGDPKIEDYCRYDTDAPPDGTDASLALDTEELATRDESAKTIQQRRARSTYRRLEELARQNGFPDLQSRMFLRRQEMGRKLQRDPTSWFFAETQRLTMGYGESYQRILGTSAMAIGCFWVISLFAGSLQQNGERIYLGTTVDQPILLIDTLFHSIHVFFTGTGLLEPATRFGELLIIAESAVGPILLALLVFVLGRRAAR